MSANGSIQRTRKQAPDPHMHIHAVVSNCCFSILQTDFAYVTSSGVRVVLTFGAHLYVAGCQVDWEQLNTLVQIPHCVGIGECRGVAWITLDHTWNYRELRFIFISVRRPRCQWFYLCRGRRAGDDHKVIRNGILSKAGLQSDLWVPGIGEWFTTVMPIPGEDKNSLMLHYKIGWIGMIQNVQWRLWQGLLW